MNFLLFITKLYVGLSVNSISIYSDGVNNLFDGLSAVVSALCIMAVVKSIDISTKALTAKIEQFLSFLLSVIVGITGFVFAYSSLERLMYPTPIWFSVSFVWVLLITVIVKLLMFLFFRYQGERLGSRVLKVMSVDCVLDFFITLVTIISLLVSKTGTYAFDAFCGIGISIVIIVSAVKMIISGGKELVNFEEKEKRDALCRIISDFGIDNENSELIFSFDSEKRAYLKTEAEFDENKLSELKRQVLAETGIKIYIAK